LLGVLIFQTYVYYLAFPKDRRVFKAIVYGTFVLEIFQTVLSIRDAWTFFVHSHGHQDKFTNTYTLWLTMPTLGGIVGFIGQTFFAYRVKALTRSWGLSILISLIATVSLAGAFLSGVQISEVKNLIEIMHDRGIFVSIGLWNGCAAGVDVLIAGCMTYYLLKKNTGFIATHRLVSKLVLVTIQTGLVTATMAIWTIVVFIGRAHLKDLKPINAYFLLVAIPISKFYSNTLLVVLNSRARILGGRESTGCNNPVFESLQTRRQGVVQGIHISTTVQVWSPDGGLRDMDDVVCVYVFQLCYAAVCDLITLCLGTKIRG
ncbi:hypothetical protein AMATHDRAFT_151406, partial [Amanita thiersii Skay4041]